MWSEGQDNQISMCSTTLFPIQLQPWISNMKMTISYNSTVWGELSRNICIELAWAWHFIMWRYFSKPYFLFKNQKRSMTEERIRYLVLNLYSQALWIFYSGHFFTLGFGFFISKMIGLGSMIFKLPTGISFYDIGCQWTPVIHCHNMGKKSQY